MALFKKGTFIYGATHNCCPRCQEGKAFKVGNPYNLKHASEMYERCPACNHRFLKETGFFYGAMYVSYALGVAISVAIAVAYFVLSPSYDAFSLTLLVITGLVLFYPLNYRFGRIVWMHMFTKYQADAIENKET